MGSNLQSFYDGMALVGSLIIMAAVVVLTYYVSRWYAGRMNRSGSGKHIKILDRVTVAPGCAVVVLQAGGRFYLVGVGDKNIRLLCELDDFDPEVIEDASAQATFGQLFKGFLKKSGNGGDGNGDE